MRERPWVWLILFLFLLLLAGIAAGAYFVSAEVQQARDLLTQDPSPEGARNAAAALAEAAGRTPWRVELWEEAGQYAMQGGDPQAAIRYFTQAHSRGRLSPAGSLALGDAYQQMSDLPAAIRQWQTALEAGAPLDAVYSRLAETHRLLGDQAGLLADLEAMAASRPDDPSLHYQLGLLLAAREPEAALDHLSKAAELDPALAASINPLVRSIRAARRADDLAFSLLEAGRTLASLGEWELASQAFRQAALERPAYAEAWAFLGESLQHLEAAPPGEDGLSELNRALELDPELLSAHLFLALYWQRRLEFDRALAILNDALVIYPDDPALYSELGKTLANQGDLEAALAAYQQVVSLRPQDASSYQLLVDFSLEHDYQVRETALPAARRLILLGASDPAALDAMGRVLFRLGDLPSAERYYNRALRIDPGFAPAHLHLGVLYLEQGENSAAQEKFQFVLGLAPGTPLAEQAQRLLESYFP